MQNKLSVPATILFLIMLLIPASVYAQEPDAVIVTYPVLSEQADSGQLSVYFTMVDANRRPLPKADIENASVELLGGNTPPSPAQVIIPNKPLYVALLLDTSGSMVNVIGKVKKAALEALASASPNTRFSVIQFNERSESLTPFNNDFRRLEKAVNDVKVTPNSPTCMYDALYEAIDSATRQTAGPYERSAVILFTDGKDEKSNHSPCSFYTYDDVIGKARDSMGALTSVHTIGLCEPGCININAQELKALAVGTAGFAVTGEEGDLTQAFQQIMDALDSQWMANAIVYPKQGENQAALSVKLRNGSTLNTTFNFVSQKDYQAPAGPVTALFTGSNYDEQNDMFRFNLSIGNSGQISQLIAQFWNAKSGLQALPDAVFPNPQETLEIDQIADMLEDGQEYSIRILAKDKEGNLITDKDGNTILAETIITAPPKSCPKFSISAVTAAFNDKFDPDDELLLIDLNVDIPNDASTVKYTGYINDKESGQRVYAFSENLLDQSRISEALPESLKQGYGEYQAAVTLIFVDRKELRCESELYDFQVNPPVIKWWEKIFHALNSAPFIALLIVMIISGVVIWLIFKKRRSGEPELPQAAEGVRPPVDRTAILNRSASALENQPELLLRVQEMPGQASTETVIKFFPLVLGRNMELPPLAQKHTGGGLFLNIKVKDVSRSHLKITFEDGRLYLVDLNSANGTLVDGEPLKAGSKKALTKPAQIQLGRKTTLFLETL